MFDVKIILGYQSSCSQYGISYFSIH